MTATLTTADVTTAPKMRPAKSADGVTTGIWVTLAESVALTDGGKVRRLPAGTLLSAPLCGGFHGSLNSRYEGRKAGHIGVCYRI